MLPRRQRRLKHDVVVLQNAKAKGRDGIVGADPRAVGQRHDDAVVRVRDGPHGRVQEGLCGREEGVRFGLDEVLEAALVDGEQVAVGEAALVDVVCEVVYLACGVNR